MTSFARKSQSSRWCPWVVLGLALVAACLPALAQLGTGQIEGTVSDSSGAVIPGATVTIRNLDTGSERVLTADSSGHYRAVALPPGPYSVKVEHTGFRPVERTGLAVVVGATISVDLTLEVKPVTEAVVVTEAAPVVEPEKTEVASTVQPEVLQNVPVLGRRWDNFVFLTPGVAPDAPSDSSPTAAFPGSTTTTPLTAPTTTRPSSPKPAGARAWSIPTAWPR